MAPVISMVHSNKSDSILLCPDCRLAGQRQGEDNDYHGRFHPLARYLAKAGPAFGGPDLDNLYHPPHGRPDPRGLHTHAPSGGAAMPERRTPPPPPPPPPLG